MPQHDPLAGIPTLQQDTSQTDPLSGMPVGPQDFDPLAGIESAGAGVAAQQRVQQAVETAGTIEDRSAAYKVLKFVWEDVIVSQAKDVGKLMEAAFSPGYGSIWLAERMVRAQGADPEAAAAAQEEINRAFRGAALVASFVPGLAFARLAAPGSAIAGGFIRAAAGETVPGIIGAVTRSGLSLAGVRAGAFLSGEALGGALYGGIRPLEEGETRGSAVATDAALFGIGGGVFAGGALAARRIFSATIGKLPPLQRRAAIREVNNTMRRIETSLRANGASLGDMPLETQAAIVAKVQRDVLEEVDPRALDPERLTKIGEEIGDVATEPSPRFVEERPEFGLGEGPRELSLVDPEAPFEFSRPFTPGKTEPAIAPKGFVPGPGVPEAAIPPPPRPTSVRTEIVREIAGEAPSTGEAVWSGVADRETGEVLETYTLNQARAADFHHSLLVTPEIDARLATGELIYFHKNPRGEVAATSELTPQSLLDKIAANLPPGPSRPGPVLARTKPAAMEVNGKVYRGNFHHEARDEAIAEIGEAAYDAAEAGGKVKEGFVDVDGKFFSNDVAWLTHGTDKADELIAAEKAGRSLVYEITDAQGDYLGNAVVAKDAGDPKTLHFSWFGSAGGRGSLGHTRARNVVRQILMDFPDVEFVARERISGPQAVSPKKRVAVTRVRPPRPEPLGTPATGPMHGTDPAAAVGIIHEGLRPGSSVSIAGKDFEGYQVIFEFESVGPSTPYSSPLGPTAHPGAAVTGDVEQRIKRVFLDTGDFLDREDAVEAYSAIRQALDDTGREAVPIEGVRYIEDSGKYTFGGPVRFEDTQPAALRSLKMTDRQLELEADRAFDNLDAAWRANNQQKIRRWEAALDRLYPEMVRRGLREPLDPIVQAEERELIATAALDDALQPALEPREVVPALGPPTGFQPTAASAEAKGFTGAMTELGILDASAQAMAARVDPTEVASAAVRDEWTQTMEIINGFDIKTAHAEDHVRRALSKILQSEQTAAEKGVAIELTDPQPWAINIERKVSKAERKKVRKMLQEALPKEIAPIDLPTPGTQVRAAWLESGKIDVPEMDLYETASRMTDDHLELMLDELRRIIKSEEGFIGAGPRGRTGLVLRPARQPEGSLATVKHPDDLFFEFDNEVSGMVDHVAVRTYSNKLEIDAAIFTDQLPSQNTMAQIQKALQRQFGNDRPIRMVQQPALPRTRSIISDLRRETGAATLRTLIGLTGAGIEGMSFVEDDPAQRNVMRSIGGLMMLTAAYGPLRRWATTSGFMRKFILNAAPRTLMERAPSETFRQFQERMTWSRELQHSHRTMIEEIFSKDSYRNAMLSIEGLDLGSGYIPPEFYQLTKKEQQGVIALSQFNRQLGQLLEQEGIIEAFRENYVRHFLPTQTFQRWKTHGYATLPTSGGFAQPRRLETLVELEAWAAKEGLPGPSFDLPNVQAAHLNEAYRAIGTSRTIKMLEGQGLILDSPGSAIRPIPEGWAQIQGISGYGTKMAPEPVAAALRNMAAPGASTFELLNAADVVKTWWMRSIMFWFWEHGFNALRALPLVSLNPTGFGQAWRAVKANDPLLMDAARHGLNLRSRADYGLRSAKQFERLAQQIDRIPLLRDLRHMGAHLIEKQDRLLWDQIIPSMQLFTYQTEMMKWAARTENKFLPGSAQYIAAARKAADFANVVAGRLPTELANPRLLQGLRLAMFSPQWTTTRVALSVGAAGELAELSAGRMKWNETAYLPFKMRQAALLFTLTWVGSKILSGDEPEFNPRTHKFYMRTGLRNAAGREVGLDMLGWWQDDLKVFNNPFDFIKDRLNPVLRVGEETISGRDFAGRQMTMPQRLINIGRSFGPPTEAAELAIRGIQSAVPGGAPPVSGGELLQRTTGVLATGNVSTLPRPLDIYISRYAEHLLAQNGIPKSEDNVFELSRILRGNYLAGGGLIDNSVMYYLAYRRRGHKINEPLAAPVDWMWQEGRRVMADF